MQYPVALAPELIVGVDGSPESQHALRWAAIEARRREIDLVVVHVYDWRIYGAPGPVGAPFVVDAREVADALVTEAVAEAATVAPGVSTACRSGRSGAGSQATSSGQPPTVAARQRLYVATPIASRTPQPAGSLTGSRRQP